MEIVTVFGADGPEGHSVALMLLQMGTFKVRPLVTDPNSDLAQKLQAMGTEIVTVDLDSPSSIQEALKGASRCYARTITDFSARDPLQKEIQYGYRIANACKENNIKHVVFHGSHHVHRRFGLPARHMDAKACINDYMNELGLPKTEIITPYYYENLLTAIQPTGSNCYKIAIPMGETAMDSMSVKQVGSIVASLFQNSQTWIGKSCPVSTERLTIEEYACILTQFLYPKQFKDARISVKTFVDSSTIPGSQDLGNMFQFWKKGSQKMNIAMTATLCPEIKTFNQWVAENKESIISSLEKKSTM
ncbi:nmrA-like family domain-containing protein 1 [Erpetoichthys calabaricus]|uniref:nmrA-like family domain-containing protein 1 n=1 Tax=Erpetoichthys calabaricus TaxID=27687 RepID=UPI00109F1960|nr:nmrA-like family domain-containing protein 1 [Erpetoichthys calabaricus]